MDHSPFYGTSNLISIRLIVKSKRDHLASWSLFDFRVSNLQEDLYMLQRLLYNRLE